MTRALIIIDMQMLMQHRIDSGRDHINGDAPARIAELTAAFRNDGRPIIHIRHEDEDETSPLHHNATGFAPMPCGEAEDGEAIFIKHTSSAFASTGLDEHLRKSGLKSLFIVGAVAGFCVNSTVRSGADLGYDITVIRDAVIGFDLPSAGLSARTIFDVTMAHLDADFAKIEDTASVLRAA